MIYSRLLCFRFLTHYLVPTYPNLSNYLILIFLILLLFDGLLTKSAYNWRVRASNHNGMRRVHPIIAFINLFLIPINYQVLFLVSMKKVWLLIPKIFFINKWTWLTEVGIAISTWALLMTWSPHCKSQNSSNQRHEHGPNPKRTMSWL